MLEYTINSLACSAETARLSQQTFSRLHKLFVIFIEVPVATGPALVASSQHERYAQRNLCNLVLVPSVGTNSSLLLISGCTLCMSCAWLRGCTPSSRMLEYTARSFAITAKATRLSQQTFSRLHKLFVVLIQVTFAASVAPFAISHHERYAQGTILLPIVSRFAIASFAKALRCLLL